MGHRSSPKGALCLSIVTNIVYLYPNCSSSPLYAGFCGPRVAARPTTTLRASRTPVVKVAAASGYQWLNKNPLALVLGVVGWTLPASIGVPAFGGNSLFGAFTASISSELAHFPTGPALTDELYVLTFIVLCVVVHSLTHSLTAHPDSYITTPVQLALVGFLSYWPLLGIDSRPNRC